MSRTKIDYLDYSWNFMGGCSPCSKGCDNCWACRQAAGRLKNHPLYKGLTENGEWTGEICLCTDIGRADLLEKPLHWREPRKIGVQFMGDLFHEDVPYEFIDKVLNVFSLCPRHTGQILTKRAARMFKYFVEYKAWLHRSRSGKPLPNVHLGVSICTPDEKPKMDILRQIPAAMKYISFEPLLADMGELDLSGIDGAIVGGESGSKARYCQNKWVVNIINQCRTVNVPIFIKQLHLNGKAKAIKDINKFPPDLRIREYPVDK